MTVRISSGYSVDDPWKNRSGKKTKDGGNTSEQSHFHRTFINGFARQTGFEYPEDDQGNNRDNQSDIKRCSRIFPQDIRNDGGNAALTDNQKDARTLQEALEGYLREKQLPILVRSSTIDSEGARHVASTHL